MMQCHNIFDSRDEYKLEVESWKRRKYRERLEKFDANTCDVQKWSDDTQVGIFADPSLWMDSASMTVWTYAKLNGYNGEPGKTM